jgi:pantoate--beta-alanine ligase
MIVARTRAELEEALAGLRAGGASTALVPTMGFLHAGHLSLLDRAAELADTVVVSIYVNPLQFGPGEDPARHPRDEVRDLEHLRARGAALVFAPSDEVMVPDGEPQVTIQPGPMARRLCGAFLPGHFRGVLTTVARLLGLLRPDVAVFGQKDFQQAVLVRRMVRDLALGVRVETAPIVREPDGLAMSTRNDELGPEERREALGLHEALVEAGRYFTAGERRADTLVGAARSVLGRHPLLEPQYVELVDPDSLDSVEVAAPGSVLALAAFCGTTRLTDNVEL